MFHDHDRGSACPLGSYRNPAGTRPADALAYNLAHPPDLASDRIVRRWVHPPAAPMPD